MLIQRIRAVSAFLALALPVGAQTGAFADGELLVRARDLVSLDYVLSRIDPLTGAGAVFLEDITSKSGSQSGWMAYDPYRDGVLMYSKYAPVGALVAELLLARSDGQVTRLGFAGEKITALAPVGDGRVYLMLDEELHLLDAANRVTPVLDEFGVPVDLVINHLIYDAPSNALIGATRSGVSGALCSSNLIRVSRLPLTVAGNQLSGPATCNGYAAQFGGAIVGLDRLPNGNVLMTQADGLASDKEQLYTVDPVTLSIGLWASSSVSDLDGGVWAQTVGKAIVLDDTSNVLRLYGEGDSGFGPVLPTSVPLGDGTTGWAQGNDLTDINITATPCAGTVDDLGVGLAGKGGFVPRLGAASCPRIGKPLPLTLSDGVGAGVGLVMASFDTAATPLLGGTLYLAPPLLVAAPFALTGTSAQSGKGTAQVVLLVPNNPGLVGVSFAAQAVVIDSAAVEGYSFTQALEITIG